METNISSETEKIAGLGSTENLETEQKSKERMSQKRASELQGTAGGSKKARLEEDECEAVITVTEDGRCKIEVLDDVDHVTAGVVNSRSRTPVSSTSTSENVPNQAECKESDEESEIFEAIMTVSTKGRCSFELLGSSADQDNLLYEGLDEADRDGKEQSEADVSANEVVEHSSFPSKLDRSASWNIQSKSLHVTRQFSNLTSQQKTGSGVRLNGNVNGFPAIDRDNTENVIVVDLTETDTSTVSLDLSDSSADTVKEKTQVVDSKKKSAGKIPDVSDYVALDCEFVGVKKITEEGLKLDISALGRCSIVDYHGKVLCDIYARPTDPISHYRTKWSGITKHHMQSMAIPACQALVQISKFIKDKIVVGHALKNDFSVLKIDHPVARCRDTALYRPFLQQFSTGGVSLKTLASNLLGKTIQKKSHCSIVDAQTTMDVFKTVREEWEQSISSGQSPVIVEEASKKKKPRKKKKPASSFSNNGPSGLRNSGPSGIPKSIQSQFSSSSRDNRQQSVYQGHSGSGHVNGYNNYQNYNQNGYHGYTSRHNNQVWRPSDFHHRQNGYRHGGNEQYHLDNYFEDEFWPAATNHM